MNECTYVYIVYTHTCLELYLGSHKWKANALLFCVLINTFAFENIQIKRQSPFSLPSDPTLMDPVINVASVNTEVLF